MLRAAQMSAHDAPLHSDPRSGAGVLALETDERTSILAKLRRFFSNPWVGAAGSIGSIIGIPLTIYLFWAGQEEPDVRYYVHPVRSVLAQPGTFSDLTVLYKGQPTAGPVTTASVILWNNGKRPVRQSDILSPITIRLAPGHRILAAALGKTTRAVIGLTL